MAGVDAHRDPRRDLLPDRAAEDRLRADGRRSQGVSAGLERLASACLFPGFEGLSPPDWVRRELAGGLGGVVLFSRNVADRAQLAALSASIRAERAEALIAIDEEGGDVTRLEAAARELLSREPRPRRGGRRRADRARCRSDRRRACGRRGQPRPGAGRRRQLGRAKPDHRRPLVRLGARARRPAHRGVRGRPPAPRGRRVREALSRARRDRRGLAPRAADHRGRPRDVARGASSSRFRPRSRPACSRS